jgi:hypothetical protein
MAVRHATEKERVVFRESEDLPLGWAFDVLGSSCYGMPILLPSDFLIRERAAGRLG